MRIGFWNIRKKSFIGDIVDFAYEKDLDVLMLAECTLSSALIVRELKKAHSKISFKPISVNPKFKMFTRFDTSFVKNHDATFGGNSWTINRFQVTGLISFSIIAVHLPSKMHWDDYSQSLEAVNLMNAIRQYEVANGSNSLVIGDFNMNPYEVGMTSALGLHGMKDANIVRSKGRSVAGKFYDYFYNPMWNFLGDRNVVPGTYFYRNAVHNNVMWNTFDQVLIRPSLLNQFKISDVDIATRIGHTNLIDPRTKRIKKTFSDHLPILISLNL